MLRVYLLGRFTMLNDDTELLLPTAKARHLAAFLFWQRERWVRREFLQGILWGEASEERAAGSLRTALHYLRKALRDADATDVIDIRRDSVRIKTGVGCWVDAQYFEQYAAAGLAGGINNLESLMAAVSHYRGGFLADIDADWCRAERRRLMELYLRVLQVLVETLAQAGLEQAAVSYARLWLAADPLDEAAHRALMRLYNAMGQTAMAVEQFEHCRQVLRKELGLVPGETTENLYLEIVGQLKDRKGLRLSDRTACRRHRKHYQKALKKPLSVNPLRHARLLLAYGETKALHGEYAAGMAALEEALAIYERHGEPAELAKARMVLGRAVRWLPMPMAGRAEKILEYVEPALAFYRSEGPLAELVRALLAAGDAYWLCGRNKQAASLAEECLQHAGRTGDGEAACRASLLLGLALRESFGLAEGRAYFDRAVRTASSLTDGWEMLWLILQRGIFEFVAGDLFKAEQYLREALASSRLLTLHPHKATMAQSLACAFLLRVWHYRDSSREMQLLRSFPLTDEFIPGPVRYVNEFPFVMGDSRLAAAILGNQVRAEINNLPRNMTAWTLRWVTEIMLVNRLDREAGRWAAAGIRLARAGEWPKGAALFYCLRAVALVRMGRLNAAKLCLQKASGLQDEGDRWTDAWRLRAAGLIAKTEGNLALARKHLFRSRNLFEKIGDKVDLRLVAAELYHLTGRGGGAS